MWQKTEGETLERRPKDAAANSQGNFEEKTSPTGVETFREHKTPEEGKKTGHSPTKTCGKGKKKKAER